MIAIDRLPQDSRAFSSELPLFVSWRYVTSFSCQWEGLVEIGESKRPRVTTKYERSIIQYNYVDMADHKKYARIRRVNRSTLDMISLSQDRNVSIVFY